MNTNISKLEVIKLLKEANISKNQIDIAINTSKILLEILEKKNIPEIKDTSIQKIFEEFLALEKK